MEALREDEERAAGKARLAVVIIAEPGRPCGCPAALTVFSAAINLDEGRTEMKCYKMAAILTLALAVPLLAQKAQAPKASSEQKELSYWVGTWTYEGSAKASPFGPAGEFSGSEHNEWFPGDHVVVFHMTAKEPTGKVTKTLLIMGYNAREAVYTAYGIDSTSASSSASVWRGTLQGKTWRFHTKATRGGKPIELRNQFDEVSPTAYTYKVETSADGKTWTTIEEATVRKTR